MQQGYHRGETANFGCRHDEKWRVARCLRELKLGDDGEHVDISCCEDFCSTEATPSQCCCTSPICSCGGVEVGREERCLPLRCGGHANEWIVLFSNVLRKKKNCYGLFREERHRGLTPLERPKAWMIFARTCRLTGLSEIESPRGGVAYVASVHSLSVAQQWGHHLRVDLSAYSRSGFLSAAVGTFLHCLQGPNQCRFNAGGG